MALTTYEMAARLLGPLHAYRNLVRRERRLRYLGAAALSVGVAWVLAAVLFYVDRLPSWLVPLCLALTVALPLAALLSESLRKPTIRETARLVDARLDDRQRVVTAVEVIEGEEARPVAQAQVVTTTGLLERVDPRAVYPVRAPASAFFLSAGLLLLALGLFMLKGLGSDEVPMANSGLPGEQALAALMSPTPLPGLPGSEMTPTPPPGAEGTPQAPQETGAPDPNAESQAEASQQAQSSLDRLRDALGEQSATQQASDSLRQGNVEQAAKELAELGEQNDQLSDAAKEGLADSLERAANDTWDDPGLQAAERNAAEALRNGSYEEIQRALRNLGQAAQSTARNVVPQDELAQSFPEQPQGGSQPGQPGDQQGEQSGQTGQTGQTGQSGQQQGDQSQAGNPSQGQEEGAGGGEGGQQSGQEGEGQGSASSGGQDNGEQGQSSGGAGDGHRVSGPRDTTDLNVEGNPFELEGRPDPNNSQPTERNDDPPALTLEGGSGTGSTSSPSTPGETVTTPGESNRLPVERWSIIQRYFSRER